MMEIDKQQYLETFLQIVRGSKNKNQFLKNVQQFDNRFTQAFQGPSFQNKASYESFQSVQQVQMPPQKPKNPFISQNQERNFSPSRSNNFIQQQQGGYYNVGGNVLSRDKMGMGPSRSQKDFFKQPQQAAKTYHAGFGAKQFQRGHFNQQQPQLPLKGPQFAWQTPQPYTQAPQYLPPQNYYEQQMRQNFNQMRKNFAAFSLTDQQKYPNMNNDLSINSHYNLPNEGQQNEFLAAFSRDDQGMGKYYKAPIPYPPKQEGQSSRAYLDKRVNPFANQ